MKLALIFFLSCFILGCDKSSNDAIYLEGYAQGTTFHITYIDPEKRDFSNDIDALFKSINRSMSIYDSTSVISRINNNSYEEPLDSFFIEVILKSRNISERTNGAFDITIGPLVNAWGFGNSQKVVEDTVEINYLKNLVDYRNINLSPQGRLSKKYSQIKLDVNGVAQGYTVDVISDFFINNGIYNYMVEVGGEVMTHGFNDEGKPWKIGIDKPVKEIESTRKLEAVVTMNHFRAMATSGSYRKFYLKDGKKYSHTISPFTGRPVDHQLLSVSVFAKNALTADAFATAFMVLGKDRSLEILKREKNLGAFFISEENKEYITYISDNLKRDLTLEK